MALGYALRARKSWRIWVGLLPGRVPLGDGSRKMNGALPRGPELPERARHGAWVGKDARPRIGPIAGREGRPRGWGSWAAAVLGWCDGEKPTGPRGRRSRPGGWLGRAGGVLLFPFFYFLFFSKFVFQGFLKIVWVLLILQQITQHKNNYSPAWMHNQVYETYDEF